MGDEERGDPQVSMLNDLVAYQEGSVVSRQLVRKPAGNVTMFAFAAGEGLSEHTAPFDALVVVTEGTAAVTIDGEPYAVGAGESLRMPAHRPPALHADQPFKMMLVMIRA